MTILDGLGDVPTPPPGAGTLGTGKFEVGREGGSPMVGRGGRGRSGVGNPVGIVGTALRTAEIDERSTELVSVGRGGNPAVGRSAVGIAPVGREGLVGSPAPGIEGPGSDGTPVGAFRTDAPGIDVRTTGVGMTPAVGSEAIGRAPTGGLTGGATGGKGRAGEAETWKTYAPSDIRMS